MSRQELEQEVRRAEALRRSLLGYAGEYLTQVAQRSACGVLHLTRQRFAVWLLMLTDRLGADVIEITQERIAEHLGVRRAGVTVIVAELQDSGIVNSSRGLLRVTDRPALESVACECYAAMSTRGRDRVAV